MKYYTMGEVFRLKLLKNNRGKPYADKASLVGIFKKIGAVDMKTPWGMAKCITRDQINSFNKSQKYDD